MKIFEISFHFFLLLLLWSHFTYADFWQHLGLTRWNLSYSPSSSSFFFHFYLMGTTNRKLDADWWTVTPCWLTTVWRHSSTMCMAHCWRQPFWDYEFNVSHVSMWQIIETASFYKKTKKKLIIIYLCHFIQFNFGPWII